MFILGLKKAESYWKYPQYFQSAVILNSLF